MTATKVPPDADGPPPASPISAPLVSVIIPTYNRAATLPRAIASAHAQSVRDLEVLVVDDGSTDTTRTVLAPAIAAGTIRYFKRPHRGAGAARNHGLREARGRYLAFLDSDDEWLDNFLEVMLDTIGRAPRGTALVHSDMLRIAPNGRQRVLRTPEVVQGRLIDPRTGDYQTKGLGILSVVAVSKLLKAGHRFDESLSALEDLDLLLRLAQHTRFHAVHRPLARYYAGSGVSSQRANVAQARYRLLVRHRHRLADNPNHLAYQYAKIALAHQRAGRPGLARRFGRRAIALAPFSRAALIALLPTLRLTAALDASIALETRLANWKSH